jgi:hypothetical protein
MNVYLICSRRKNKPKISVEVCRSCKRRKTCREFSQYRNPPLFEGYGKHQGNAIP